MPPEISEERENVLRKLASIGLTVTTVFALAAVAVAQSSVAPVVTVTATVNPAKGGSTKKPVNAATAIKFDVNPESNSTLASIDYGVPKSLKISGAGFESCSATTVNTKGEAACPPKAKVGTGASTALLGPGKAPINFKVNVYASGASGLTLALKQDPQPASGGIQVAFDAKIANGHISFDIPENIQQPVKSPDPTQSLYSYVTSVTANLGPAQATKTVKVKKTVKKHGKKKKITVKVKKKYFLVSRIGCNGGKDIVGVSLGLAANPNPPAVNPAIGTGSTPCNK